MITTVLKGGLGNMMFQVAAIEHLAHKNNSNAYYFNVNEQFTYLDEETDHNPELSHSQEYKSIFENFHWPSGPAPEKMANLPFEYIELPFHDGICYHGFFQSEKNFTDREFIIKLFKPSSMVKKVLERYQHLFDKGTTCSVHIRRGDYLKFPHMHNSRSMDYYNKGMEIINADKYLIFSDDIEWCKENFVGDQYHFMGDRDYIEMFLMSQCDHNIMCSSSFSWWGSYLNTNPEKTVIAPKKWFVNNEHNETDIVPESYNKI